MGRWGEGGGGGRRGKLTARGELAADNKGNVVLPTLVRWEY